ncbi:hypothetical protein [Gracilibacillus suaedae]|uniref:hypothetical protein n=1 Tax=Gracilibacillus suaedae TaxID=2820273 RepID=UPI001E481DEF|nr:hypothetical protein [Gracilibacillus suaedae]
MVDKNNGLVGFFCIGKPAQVPAGFKVGAYQEGFVDIGIGMKPELTGRGNGSSFSHLFFIVLKTIILHHFVCL